MTNTRILQQQTRNKKTLQNVATPDTDSRYIELNSQGLVVTPDMMHDHTRMKYTSPVANIQTVRFYSPKNWEDRTLHFLEIDNSNNTQNKTFQFNQDYIFQDDLLNVTNSYTLDAGQKLVWFCTLIKGKLYLRVASEST